MSRYIDADAVIKTIAEQDMFETQMEYVMASDDFEDYAQSVRELLKDLPLIDIVQCKECKYWHKNIKGDDGIPIADICYDFQADDFCSYGEREDE